MNGYGLAHYVPRNKILIVVETRSLTSWTKAFEAYCDVVIVLPFPQHTVWIG